MSQEEDRAKLIHLIGHWVEHNKAHAEGYTEWAAKARGMGEEAAADLIMQAVGAMEEADHLLLMALQVLQG
jgi:hypothetical protein